MYTVTKCVNWSIVSDSVMGLLDGTVHSRWAWKTWSGNETTTLQCGAHSMQIRPVHWFNCASCTLAEKNVVYWFLRVVYQGGVYLSLSDWQISITCGRGFKDTRLMRNSVQGDVYQKVTVEGLWCHICQTTAVVEHVCMLHHCNRKFRWPCIWCKFVYTSCYTINTSTTEVTHGRG